MTPRRIPLCLLFALAVPAAAAAQQPAPTPPPASAPATAATAGQPASAPVEQLLRLTAADPSQRFTASLESGGARFACEAPITAATPCELKGVPPGPATLTVSGSAEFIKALEVPAGAGSVALSFTPGAAKRSPWVPIALVAGAVAGASVAAIGFTQDRFDLKAGAGFAVPLFLGGVLLYREKVQREDMRAGGSAVIGAP